MPFHRCGALVLSVGVGFFASCLVLRLAFSLLGSARAPVPPCPVVPRSGRRSACFARLGFVRLSWRPRPRFALRPALLVGGRGDIDTAAGEVCGYGPVACLVALVSRVFVRSRPPAASRVAVCLPGGVMAFLAIACGPVGHERSPLRYALRPALLVVRRGDWCRLVGVPSVCLPLAACVFRLRDVWGWRGCGCLASPHAGSLFHLCGVCSRYCLLCRFYSPHPLVAAVPLVPSVPSLVLAPVSPRPRPFRPALPRRLVGRDVVASSRCGSARLPGRGRRRCLSRDAAAGGVLRMACGACLPWACSLGSHRVGSVRVVRVLFSPRPRSLSFRSVPATILWVICGFIAVIGSCSIPYRPPPRSIRQDRRGVV